MTAEKQSSLSETERGIWTDVYRFHATFSKMGNEPEDWTKCAATMTQVFHKHKDHDLAKLLLFAVYDYLVKERSPVKEEGHDAAVG